MTAIVGLIDGGSVWMGADSSGVRLDSMCQRSDPKVFAAGEFIVSYTASFRLGQVVRFCSDKESRRLQDMSPKNYDPCDPHELMVRVFVPWLREVLTIEGCIKTPGDLGGELLVGFNGRLFTVFSDFSVGESILPYAASGAGDKYVLGNMFATQGLGMPPEERVRGALSAAANFSTVVCEPFRVLSMPSII